MYGLKASVDGWGRLKGKVKVHVLSGKGRSKVWNLYLELRFGRLNQGLGAW